MCFSKIHESAAITNIEAHSKVDVALSSHTHTHQEKAWYTLFAHVQNIFRKKVRAFLLRMQKIILTTTTVFSLKRFQQRFSLVPRPFINLKNGLAT